MATQPSMFPRPHEDLHTSLVIVPHHPDRLRRPPVRIGTVASQRFVQALQWNVFRTFELLPPAFWLRRLHARLTGSVQERAPHTVRVELWPLLPLPPSCQLDGERSGVRIDVLIETEHAVWALCGGDEWRRTESPRNAITGLVQAATWRAGSRQCHIGFLEMTERRDSPGTAFANRPGIGSVRWNDVALVLLDCAESSVLTPIERALARHAVEWLAGVGVYAGARALA